MKIDSDKMINEIVGLTTGTVRRSVPPGSTGPTQPPYVPFPHGTVAGVAISHSYQLYGWQSQVVDTLARGKDVYVIATPSAGKTLPVITYWARQHLEINPELLNRPQLSDPSKVYRGLMRLFLNPKDIKKLVFLVPVRSLVYNTYEDIVDKFSKLLWIAIQKAVSQRYVDLLLNTLLKFNYKGRDQLLRVKQAKDDLNRDYMNHVISSEEYAQKFQKSHIEFMKALEVVIPEFVKNNLVYAKTGAGTVGRANPKTAPVIITIYESIQSIFSAIKNDIGLAVIDEAHLTQQLADEIDHRTPEIVNKLYWFIKKLPKNRGNTNQLAFLSGTINPDAAKNLSEYLGTCYNRPLEILNDAPVGNPATIKVIPADWTNDETTLVKEIVNPRMSNTLIIIFSKNKIDQLIDNALSKAGYATAKQVSGGIYQRPNLVAFNREEVKKDLNFQISPGAEEISDEKLSRAVSAGFGWIYRPSDELSGKEAKERQADNGIVANLFKTGKIKTLLATDAVGIGVNIDVQRMIIPSIEKFSGKEMKELPVSQLAQLLNRTGRQTFKIGIVYTAEENVGKVVHALSIGPERFETRVTLPMMPKALCTRVEDIPRSLWSAMKRKVSATIS